MNRVTRNMIEVRLNGLKEARQRRGCTHWLRLYEYNGKSSLEVVNARDEEEHTTTNHAFAGTKSECLDFIAGALFAEHTS